MAWKIKGKHLAAILMLSFIVLYICVFESDFLLQWRGSQQDISDTYTVFKPKNVNDKVVGFSSMNFRRRKLVHRKLKQENGQKDTYLDLNQVDEVDENNEKYLLKQVDKKEKSREHDIDMVEKQDGIIENEKSENDRKINANKKIRNKSKKIKDDNGIEQFCRTAKRDSKTWLKCSSVGEWVSLNDEILTKNISNFYFYHTSRMHPNQTSCGKANKEWFVNVCNERGPRPCCKDFTCISGK